MCYDCMRTKLTQKDDAIIPANPKNICRNILKVALWTTPCGHETPYDISMEQQYREPSCFWTKCTA